MNYTSHVLTRFAERFPEFKIAGQHDKVTVHQIFKRSVENKQIVNNTDYIVYMLETYGDCDCKFFEYKENLIFIVKGETVVTLIDRRNAGENSPFRKANPKSFRKK